MRKSKIHHAENICIDLYLVMFWKTEITFVLYVSVLD